MLPIPPSTAAAIAAAIARSKAGRSALPGWQWDPVARAWYNNDDPPIRLSTTADKVTEKQPDEWDKILKSPWLWIGLAAVVLIAKK